MNIMLKSVDLSLTKEMEAPNVFYKQKTPLLRCLAPRVGGVALKNIPKLVCFSVTSTSVYTSWHRRWNLGSHPEYNKKRLQRSLNGAPSRGECVKKICHNWHVFSYEREQFSTKFS